MTVVTALELDDFATPGEAAGEADGTHRRFGAGADQSDLFQRRHQLPQQFGHFDFDFRRRAERQAAFSRLLYGAYHIGMGVTADQRPPGTDIVDVTVAVGVPYQRPFAALEKQRRTAHRFESPHG